MCRHYIDLGVFCFRLGKKSLTFEVFIVTRDRMDILLVQAALEWLSPDANRKHIGAMLADTRGADLIVLPEMFTTGFVTDTNTIAEKDETRSLEWMRALAQDSGAAVVGSVAVEDGGRFFNRCYFVRPDGTFVSYDKRHLFGFGGEHVNYTPGRERVVVEWAGFRILLQVCYDLRFPVFSRNMGDYDMILYVASWSQARRKVLDVLLRARAIENVCYVAGVNRVGSDPASEYDGGTAMIDFKGDVMERAEDNCECVVRAKADIGELMAFRAKFPVLDDADDFELKI